MGERGAEEAKRSDDSQRADVPIHGWGTKRLELIAERFLGGKPEIIFRDFRAPG